MDIFKDILTDDLFTIINSETLPDLTALLSPDGKKHLKKEIKKISVGTPQFKKTQVLLATFTEGPSLPFYLLGLIIGSIGLVFMPLLVYTCIFTLLLFLTGGIYSGGTYLKLRDNIKEDTQLTQFTLFRIACMDELIKRLKQEAAERHINYQKKIPTLYTSFLTSNATAANTPLLTKPKKKKNPLLAFLPRLKESMSPTMILGYMIFECFYIPAVIIVHAFALTSVAAMLTNPIGIGVILGVIGLFCLYMGYKHYQHNKQKELFQKKTETIKKDFHDKYKECYELKELLDHKKRDRQRSIPEPLTSQERKRIPPFNIKRNFTGYFANTNVLFRKVPQTFKQRYHHIYQRSSHRHIPKFT